MSLRCLLGLHKNVLVTNTICRPFIDDYGRKRIELSHEDYRVCERCGKETFMGKRRSFIAAPKGTLV